MRTLKAWRFADHPLNARVLAGLIGSARMCCLRLTGLCTGSVL